MDPSSKLADVVLHARSLPQRNHTFVMSCWRKTRRGTSSPRRGTRSRDDAVDQGDCGAGVGEGGWPVAESQVRGDRPRMMQPPSRCVLTWSAYGMPAAKA